MWGLGGKISISWLLQRGGERNVPKWRKEVSEGLSPHIKYVLLLLDVLQSYVQLGRVPLSAYFMLLCATCLGAVECRSFGLCPCMLLWLLLPVSVSVMLWIHEGLSFKYKHMCLWIISWTVLLLRSVTKIFFLVPSRYNYELKKAGNYKLLMLNKRTGRVTVGRGFFLPPFFFLFFFLYQLTPSTPPTPPQNPPTPPTPFSPSFLLA